MKYEIIYDYSDEYGYEYCNNKETFCGDWFELQNVIKQMRKNGCYNITAVCVED